MLEKLFFAVLDMSAAGSIVVLVVLLARLALRKAPKVFSYALWAVVLLRLMCPVTLSAPVSLVPQLESVAEDYSLAGEEISVFGASEAAYRAAGDALNGGLGIQHIRTTEQDLNGNTVYVTSSWWDVWLLFGQYVWLAGVLVMAAVNGVRSLRLRHKLREAVPRGGNVFVTDRVGTPFVMGLLRPKIYIPAGLSGQEERCILAHEGHHIRRMDHVVKALLFGALCIHWFNPLVWLAFRLAVQDMEMSCDEAAIRQLGADVREDYARALLRLAAGRDRLIPLAFSQGDTKRRIYNMANWKRPKRWAQAAGAVFCCVVMLLCGCTRAEEEAAAPASGTYLMGDGENLIAPSLRLDMEQMRFSLSYDVLSSYWPVGTMEIEDGIITCTTYDGWCSYAFEIVDGETLRYIRGDLLTVENKLAVPTGAEFSYDGELTWEIPTPVGGEDTTAQGPSDLEVVIGQLEEALDSYQREVTVRIRCRDTDCTDTSHHHDEHHGH